MKFKKGDKVIVHNASGERRISIIEEVRDNIVRIDNYLWFYHNGFSHKCDQRRFIHKVEPEDVALIERLEQERQNYEKSLEELALFVESPSDNPEVIKQMIDLMKREKTSQK